MTYAVYRDYENRVATYHKTLCTWSQIRIRQGQSYKFPGLWLLDCPDLDDVFKTCPGRFGHPSGPTIRLLLPRIDRG